MRYQLPRISTPVIALIVFVLFTLSMPTALADSSAVQIGDTLSSFMMPEYPTGDYVALRDLCGKQRPNTMPKPRKVVVLSFFAYFCEPCKREIPATEELSKQWGDGAVMLLISVGDKPEQIADWLAANPTELKILMDPYKATSLERYGVDSLPTTFVLDRQGVLRYIHIGYRDGDELAVDKIVRELLEE